MIVIFCRKCATKLEDNYVYCPICSESTTANQVIIGNGKKVYFGFSGGYITIPIAVFAILILFSIIGSIYNEVTKYMHILIPFVIITYGIFMAWKIDNKRPNTK